MKLDVDSIWYILIYMTFLISIIGCLACFCKKSISHQIEYILIKNIFLNRFKYSEILEPRQYFSFQKYDVWRYCSLF
ncbi:Prokaryotic membrane lipoprotein lipid attachment site profile [Romboutsia lituseburensis]|uniref:Uncharacterized protein n=1 Tax=Romboutsia lituseburensis DSM 797 TaxID=1121325 RepID=A0A1G9IAM7_9FIRM|nr:Prokaryotic membrane lipoprotein lipid attachment site profile [Romboutsia lituseburensis]SDL22318.1 hypothetical protein SAMN04515677_101171 [Romboutsia lituseburensis DSM 797]